MLKINTNYDNLKESYLFSEIAKRVAAFAEANPDANIIRLGIGDVTLPLCNEVIKALHSAVDEMADGKTFKGYGPEQGHLFLREAIQNYYKKHNVSIETSEIFISDGAKSDVGNILDIFDKDNVVLVPDPVYPVYVDTNIMHGRKTIFMNATGENGFLPLPDSSVKCDIIYLCSPNNPTGATYNRTQLKAWVDYAKANGAVILFDSAYEAFVEDADLPRSIFEIEGAKECAIEFCSFSKTAGFTGVRLGYTVVPAALLGGKLNKMWLRRQSTKFNGASYIVQKGGAAIFTEEGQKQVMANIKIYKENAKVITKTFDALGIEYTGGKNSPYIWFKCPNNMKSWDFFDLLLTKAQVVGTPGAGFGNNGEGWFRLTAFNTLEKTQEAMKRFEALLKA